MGLEELDSQKRNYRTFLVGTFADFSLCPVYWTAAMVEWYHRSNKEELKCTKEAVLVISMHSKAPARELIAAVPPVDVADVVHGFM